MASRDTHINRYLRRKNIYFTHPYSYYKLSDSIEKNYFQVLKEDIFRISDELEIIYPQIKITKTSLDSVVDDWSRVVVINPYSNSMFVEDMFFWIELIKMLRNDGKKIYTNVVDPQTPLEGTLPLSCSVFEFYNICRKAKLVISIRSGIIDFSISSGGNFFVLWYEHPDEIVGNSVKKLCDLNAWRIGNVRQCYYDSANNSLNQFIDFYGSL